MQEKGNLIIQKQSTGKILSIFARRKEPALSSSLFDLKEYILNFQSLLPFTFLVSELSKVTNMMQNRTAYT